MYLNLTCLVLLILFLLSGSLPPEFQSTGIKTTANPATLQKPVESREQKTGKPGLPIKNTPGLGDFLEKINAPSSGLMSVKTAMALWNTEAKLNRFLDDLDNDALFFRLAARQNNFEVLYIYNDWNLIESLNLPAVLEFHPPGNLAPRYLTVTKINENDIVLKGGEKEKEIRVKPGELGNYWSGAAYILWKNFFDYRGHTPGNSTNESVITLKMLLRDIGFNEVGIDPYYDEPARKAVKQIQQRHGIKTDGIAGPHTIIAVYNEKKELKIPHIIPGNDLMRVRNGTKKEF